MRDTSKVCMVMMPSLRCEPYRPFLASVGAGAKLDIGKKTKNTSVTQTPRYVTPLTHPSIRKAVITLSVCRGYVTRRAME